MPDSSSSVATDVTVMFDSGNDAESIFPASLLKYSADATPHEAKVQCAGNNDNHIRLTHRGTLCFRVPLDPEGERVVHISGLFASQRDSTDNEIILSRLDMPTAPGLNEGTNYPVTGQLKDYPGILVG